MKVVLSTEFLTMKKRDLTQSVFVKQLLWSIVFAVFAAVVLLMSISYLQTNYPDPVRPDDIVLDSVPQMKWANFISDVAGATSVLVILYILSQDRFKRVPKLLFLLSMMYLIRAVAINLTPLAEIQPPDDAANILVKSFYHGMFFSGHTANILVMIFFVDKHHPLRPILQLLAVVVVTALLATHSHYSIDIFGGFFVAYFVTHYDFMGLVPKPLLKVKIMPWYEDDD